MKSVLRQGQVNAIALLRQSILAGHKRPMLQAPTGMGKTVLAAAIVEGALAKGNRVMFVVPAISLIDQTIQRFYSEGIQDIGVIQSDHPLTNYNAPVQVVSVQTLMRRTIEYLPHADVIVVDEAHRWFVWYEKWFAAWADRLFIGLSATPWTKGLGKHYDDLIIASTTQELIDQGLLSDFKVFAPSHPDLSKVRIVAGDYHEGDLSEVMGDKQLVSDVVNTWLRMAENRPTLCFAVDRAHAKKLQNDFIAAGVCAEYIDANTDRVDRQAIAKRFHDGEVKVIANVGVLTTGIDWDVRCISYCRPTRSESLFVQIIGRGLRTAPGKSKLIILDHSDTHLRLGFVTDIIHYELDDGTHAKSKDKKEREKPLPKDCPSCGYVKPAGISLCPHCGFKPERQSQVETADGKLAELKRSKKENRIITPEEKAQFYGELKGYAIGHGYSEGWAAHKYRAKFGVWPNKYSEAVPAEASKETLNFITSQNIRYNKRRA